MALWPVIMAVSPVDTIERYVGWPTCITAANAKWARVRTGRSGLPQVDRLEKAAAPYLFCRYSREALVESPSRRITFAGRPLLWSFNKRQLDKSCIFSCQVIEGVDNQRLGSPSVCRSHIH